jgi:hypothetical protein
MCVIFSIDKRACRGLPDFKVWPVLQEKRAKKVTKA